MLKCSRDEKMKIGILGGSFDPPHLGHQRLAQRLIKTGLCDEVWLMPCYAHVWRKKLSSVKHRLAMTKLLENKKIKVSTLEIEQKRAVPTRETLKMLTVKYPQDYFFWIVSEKSRVELSRWQDYEKIKNEILIVPEIKGISSSKVRLRVKKDQPINKLVPTKVAKYIAQQELYKENFDCNQSER